MSCLRASLQLDLGVGFGSVAESGQTAVAGVVRVGLAVLPAAVPQSGQRRCKRAFLPPATGPCCAQVEHLREPFDGALEFNETTFGGRAKASAAGVRRAR